MIRTVGDLTSPELGDGDRLRCPHTWPLFLPRATAGPHFGWDLLTRSAYTRSPRQGLLLQENGAPMPWSAAGAVCGGYGRLTLVPSPLLVMVNVPAVATALRSLSVEPGTSTQMRVGDAIFKRTA